MKIFYNIVCSLFALFMINGGINKFFHYMPMPEDMPQELIDLMNNFDAVGWLMPLLAIEEILGGILVLIPKTRALGAIVLLPAILGILLTHINQAPDGLIMAVIFFAVEVWIIMKNKDKYLAMVQ